MREKRYFVLMRYLFKNTVLIVSITNQRETFTKTSYNTDSNCVSSSPIETATTNKGVTCVPTSDRCKSCHLFLNVGSHFGRVSWKTCIDAHGLSTLVKEEVTEIVRSGERGSHSTGPSHAESKHCN